MYRRVCDGGGGGGRGCDVLTLLHNESLTVTIVKRPSIDNVEGSEHGLDH